MMKFIEFEKEKCDSCYKCLRVCPTKAISFHGTDRKIVNDLCIKCGLCQSTCPQEALTIRSQMAKLNELIAKGERIYVSLAPSYVGAFGLDRPKQIVSALKDLGFSMIEETAYGAEIIASYYDTYIQRSGNKNIITSCCPSANYLIEQYYPSLISYVIPVVSPMIAHGKAIKKRFGKDVTVVFIGPCLAKMAEAEEMEGAIDLVLTFEELDKLLKDKGKRIQDYEEQSFDALSSQRGKAFPLGGSLRDCFNRIRKDGKYRYIHADGIESCREILDEMGRGNLDHCCVEINICEGSCINGPDMPKNSIGRFAREMYLREYSREVQDYKNQIDLQERMSVHELRRNFQDKQRKRVEPNHDTIGEILRRTGKYSKQDELNCGACGYKTCYDKAKAVHYGYSDVETCLPYLRKKAESMQSVMIENSPNAIVLLDKELTIKEVNPGFLRAFNPGNLPVSEMPIALFISDQVFKKAVLERKSIVNEKIYVNELKRYFLVNLIYLEENRQLLGFFTDISLDENRQQEFNRVKEETLRKTQEVIDKQMRVAQEIASLLGETTAETKMSLKSLNELVLRDRGGY